MEDEMRYAEALECRWVLVVRLLVAVDFVWCSESVRGCVLIGVVCVKVDVVRGVGVVARKLARVAAWW